ncbi:MAG: hypothetical protein EDM79_13830 [Chloroflexi bacterium]|nr:MAG: hypothetical protein EDM79_13830 [Chloroflexota bacterium]
MNEQEIRIDVKRYESGSLRAFADVLFSSPYGEFTLRGFRVVQKADAGPWVAFPSNSFTKDGKVVNRPIIEAGPGFKRRIAEAVLAAYRQEKGT